MQVKYIDIVVVGSGGSCGDGKMEKEIAKCDECGSEYYAGSSLMKSICPECAHALYGYTNCAHVFENGRCILCYWDGRKSKFTEKLSKAEEPDSHQTPVSEAYALMQDGKFKEALKIFNDPVKTDQNTASANLLRLLCCYQVKNTEELLGKAASSIAAFKVFTRRAELDSLTRIQNGENNIAENMMEYCLLKLMLSGNTLSYIAKELYSPKNTNHPKQESAFAKMDKEDVHNFKRSKALYNSINPYEFDPLEELDDIKVKFKSTLDNPDHEVSDVVSAGANLLLDMLTFLGRSDAYYSGNDSISDYPRSDRDHLLLREHDYGVNKLRKDTESKPGIYTDEDPVQYMSTIRNEGISETEEGKLARQLELIELINEEEKSILAQII